LKQFLATSPILFLILLSCCGKGASNKDDQPKVVSKPVAKSAPNEALLQVDNDAQRRAGIRTQVLEARKITPEIAAYGHLEEDPATTFVLRAPIAGILRENSGRSWPRVGERVDEAAMVGNVEPRFTPNERIGLNTQLASARSDLDSATASVSAARAAYERTRHLNADNKNIADRVVEEAEAHLRSEEARAKSAAETVRVVEASLMSAGFATPQVLRADRPGDVVEVLAQPGENIEPGAPLLRLAQLDMLLARIDVPVGYPIAPSALTARIVPAGHEDEAPLSAQRVAVSAAVDPRAQGIPLLFRIAGTRFGLRPGLAVTAYIPGTAKAVSGFLIPQAAIVRTTGRAWVYVQVSQTKFERRPVSLDQLVGDSYAVITGFASGDRIVVIGAQSLLSEEFKSQNSTDEQ
jgi:RND family efflux transporter MFP subunit